MILTFGMLAALAQALPEPPALVRIDPVVAAANLPSPIAPFYPALAQAARVQATVVLQAEIDKEGSVADLRVLSGHPLLNDAALQAVRQWRYKPYLTDGVAVDFVTTITIRFVLVVPPTIQPGKAAIMGRVSHADGRPAPGVRVDVVLPFGQVQLPPNARAISFLESSGEYRLEAGGQGLLRSGFLTDDAGDYRIEGIGPGTYRVVAVVNQNIYYFPGTAEGQAVLITVEANETTLVGIDFRIP